MAYIYESTQPGLFNFTIPGEDKTVSLLLGSKVSVKNKLSGGYLNVLRFIQEVPDAEETNEVQKNESKQQAKIEDKITKVEEVVDTHNDSVSVEVEDSLVAAESQDSQKKQQKKR